MKEHTVAVGKIGNRLNLLNGINGTQFGCLRDAYQPRLYVVLEAYVLQVPLCLINIELTIGRRDG